jgi:predicted secreted Zn-dependent protease
MQNRQEILSCLRNCFEEARSMRDQLVASIDRHRERGADVSEARKVQRTMETALREMNRRLEDVLE